MLKGLVNPRTTAFEMGALKRELLQCHRPLRMTEELRELDNLPTPPPFLPETPPAHLFPWFARTPSPRSYPPTPVPEGNAADYPWAATPEVGGIRELLRPGAGAAPAGQVGAGVVPGPWFWPPCPLRMIPARVTSPGATNSRGRTPATVNASA